MNTEDGWSIANRMRDAAERASFSAQRMEDSAHRMALMLEGGYGGNGLRLIELLESRCISPEEAAAKDQRIEALTAELSRFHAETHKGGFCPGESCRVWRIINDKQQNRNVSYE